MRKKKESILGMAFFGPALVLLTLFLFLPMILTLGFSFTDYFALNPEMTHFVGLENYINIFKDELFVKSFLNTVKFVLIIVPCQCGGALLLALAINKATHCKKYFKNPEYAACTVGNRGTAIYLQCQTGASVDCHHECMAGCRISDDYFPRRFAEHQSCPV